ncbi:hypothetical protein GCM10009548_73660 [Streptomyces malaysiensis subsp. malaysiensis]
MFDHTGSSAAQLRAAEEAVRLLEPVGGLGVPPDHEVGVGTQAGQVVGAADGHVLGGELVEQLLYLIGVAGAVLGERVLQLEDGPQGVADDLVEVLGRLALVRDPAGLGALSAASHPADFLPPPGGVTADSAAWRSAGASCRHAGHATARAR